MGDLNDSRKQIVVFYHCNVVMSGLRPYDSSMVEFSNCVSLILSLRHVRASLYIKTRSPCIHDIGKARMV